MFAISKINQEMTDNETKRKFKNLLKSTHRYYCHMFRHLGHRTLFLSIFCHHVVIYQEKMRNTAVASLIFCDKINLRQIDCQKA